MVRHALAGVVIASLGASDALAATKVCYPANGRSYCVEIKPKPPKGCSKPPCSVGSSATQGGNNKPVEDMMSTGVILAAPQLATPQGDAALAPNLGGLDAGKLSNKLSAPALQ
jgi:hypothetical protein